MGVIERTAYISDTQNYSPEEFRRLLSELRDVDYIIFTGDLVGGEVIGAIRNYAHYVEHISYGEFVKKYSNKKNWEKLLNNKQAQEFGFIEQIKKYPNMNIAGAKFYYEDLMAKKQTLNEAVLRAQKEGKTKLILINCGNWEISTEKIFYEKGRIKSAYKKYGIEYGPISALRDRNITDTDSIIIYDRPGFMFTGRTLHVFCPFSSLKLDDYKKEYAEDILSIKKVICSIGKQIHKVGIAHVPTNIDAHLGHSPYDIATRREFTPGDRAASNNTEYFFKEVGPGNFIYVIWGHIHRDAEWPVGFRIGDLGILGRYLREGNILIAKYESINLVLRLWNRMRKSQHEIRIRPGSTEIITGKTGLVISEKSFKKRGYPAPKTIRI